MPTEDSGSGAGTTISARPPYVQLSNTSCYARVTEFLLQPHSSRRSAAWCQSGIWTPHHRDRSAVGSEAKSDLQIDMHPYHWNLPAWVRKAGAKVPKTPGSLRQARSCLPRTETCARRADASPRRTRRRVAKARSRDPVHRSVTIEANRQPMRGSKLRSEASVQSFVSRNQTSGGSAAARDGIPLPSDPTCVASNDMDPYRSMQGRRLRNPKASPSRARRSLPETGSKVPSLRRRLPRTGKRRTRAGVRVWNPRAWGRKPILRGRNPIAKGRKPNSQGSEASAVRCEGISVGSVAWLQPGRGISQSSGPTIKDTRDCVAANDRSRAAVAGQTRVRPALTPRGRAVVSRAPAPDGDAGSGGAVDGADEGATLTPNARAASGSR
ncbi:MAG: hypothetical protein QOJ98_1108 [Acidobacteriota bacterium]|nr:hypothetical protein [Acidobacteriota bacterium]